MVEFGLWQLANVMLSTTTGSWTHNFTFLVLGINTDHYTATLTTFFFQVIINNTNNKERRILLPSCKINIRLCWKKQDLVFSVKLQLGKTLFLAQKTNLHFKKIFSSEIFGPKTNINSKKNDCFKKFWVQTI